ncbi:hypothetical protein MOJ79_02760 [Calidifontimicrobium sp. SYSU G02091]|uniref:hypothetical protein n=1 Tax=Calidifontimicrobium sp. SYSU G02091 TaxID=2926421 RepID=UPI001F53129D|nr:hypothetical protein [Calidifontimicrobium sp. SYSU G02091]MCI1190758.1 hypothetical protein [Calidifontimicrobium sp. SYSU G02091]
MSRSMTLTAAHRFEPVRMALAAALLALVLPCAAQSAITVYAGARAGGAFTDEVDGRTLTLEGGATWAASLDWPLGDGRQMQLFVSRQRSGLPGSAFGEAGTVAVDVTHVHVGGRVFIDGDAARGGAYAVGGLGVTHFSPGLDGLTSETRPSMNVGLGLQWPLAPAVALRAELRGHVTLVNSRGGFFCSGGCVVSIKGDTLTQAEALLGLSVGF